MKKFKKRILAVDYVAQLIKSINSKGLVYIAAESKELFRGPGSKCQERCRSTGKHRIIQLDRATRQGCFINALTTELSLRLCRGE
jgi:hypothetical protein